LKIDVHHNKNEGETPQCDPIKNGRWRTLGCFPNWKSKLSNAEGILCIEGTFGVKNIIRQGLFGDSRWNMEGQQRIKNQGEWGGFVDTEDRRMTSWSSLRGEKSELLPNSCGTVFAFGRRGGGGAVMFNQTNVSQHNITSDQT